MAPIPARPDLPVRCSLMRYVAHEGYARIPYGWTLGADWPLLAMVQALISNVIYADPVVYDWQHIQAPTLVFGGAEDVLPGTAEIFQQRMKHIAETIPGGKARLLPARPRPRPARGRSGTDNPAPRRVSQGRRLASCLVFK